MSGTVSIQRKRWTGVQSNRLRLHLDAAVPVRRMFDSLPEGPSRYSISRARNGDVSNPLYRMACWFTDARDAGMPSTVADEAIAYLQAQREAVWANEDLCYNTESAKEQEASADEDRWQLRAARDKARLAAHREAVEARIAQDLRLVRAIDQELSR